MKISQLMNRDVERCTADDNLAAVAARMWDCDIGCLPVVDSAGQVVGMVTDRDICIAALTRGQLLRDIPVAVAMATNVLSCSPDATLVEAEEIMRAGQVRRLPVLDSEASLVGIVSLNDLARLAGRGTGGRNSDLLAQGVTATLAAISEPRRSGNREQWPERQGVSGRHMKRALPTVDDVGAATQGLDIAPA